MPARSTAVSVFAFVFAFTFCCLALFSLGCVQQSRAPEAAAPATTAAPTAVFTASAAASTTASESDSAVAECIALCENERIAECGGVRLADCAPWSAGPCVSDVHPGRMPAGWVCDVAHSPRTSGDDDPANQCAEYRNGEAHRFVEVDPQCRFVRAV